MILSNLLSNAIQYSYDSKQIEIISKIEEDSLIISVKDYGCGISEANQKIIFDRFKRLDSGINSLNRGHGLGLAVNKALLDILGGKIEIISERDIGTTFTIHLPAIDMEPSNMATFEDDILFNNNEDEVSF